MHIKYPLNSLEDLQDAICADLPLISVSIKQFDITNSKSKAKSAAGIECAKIAIQKQLDINSQINPPNLEIKHNENGAPIFPDGLIGSISHSANLAISVCSKSSPNLRSIGIDIETKFKNSLNVLSRIATPEEINRLPFDGFTMEESAASIFCIKEAFYKAVNILMGSDNSRMRPSWQNLSILEVKQTSVSSAFSLSNNPGLKYQINLYKCNFNTPFICAVVVCS